LKKEKVAIPNWLVFSALGLAVVIVAVVGWKTINAPDQAGAELERQYMKQPRLIDSNGKPIAPSAGNQEGG
jgi:hypothetical protein